VHPALTALQRDIPAYGAKAASMLLDIIDGQPPTVVQDATARLVPRSSTGRAPEVVR
jgi:DNA-binding LacI/PurR family transcriptional regulator